MKIVLKPLFDAELPAGFEEIIRSKLVGREVKTGETVEIDLLGRPLAYKVVLADPSPMKVSKNTRIEITRSEVKEITLEFDEEVREVLPSQKVSSSSSKTKFESTTGAGKRFIAGSSRN